MTEKIREYYVNVAWKTSLSGSIFIVEGPGHLGPERAAAGVDTAMCWAGKLPNKIAWIEKAPKHAHLQTPIRLGSSTR